MRPCVHGFVAVLSLLACEPAPAPAVPSDAGSPFTTDGGAFDVTRIHSADVLLATDRTSHGDATPTSFDHPAPDSAVPCAEGEARCGDRCVDSRTSIAHCGGCDHACASRPGSTPSCVAGECRDACDPLRADCDGDPANGCESFLDSLAHCGACGVRCEEPSPHCDSAGGMPRCSSGCGAERPLRCDFTCVDPQSHPRHCGACGRECPSAPNARGVCIEGGCRTECSVGAHRCGDSCVRDDESDHCGDRCAPCPNAPNALARCVGSRCALECSPLWGDCDGDLTNGCETYTFASLSHCGACHTRCEARPNSAPTCHGGRCGVACTSPFANCDRDPDNGCETSLDTDADCGVCGAACEPAQTCVRQVCAQCTALTVGEDGYASVDDAVPLRLGDTSFTVEAWLYSTSYDNRCHHAIVTKRGSASQSGWLFSVTGAGCGAPARRLLFQVSGGLDPSVIASVDTPLNRWFHAAATYDLTTRRLTLWQDGVSVGSGSLPSPSPNSPAPLYLGNDAAGERYAWRGHLDEIRLTGRVRYSAPFTPLAMGGDNDGAIALWRFWSSGSSVTVDSSTRGYIATLHGVTQSAQALFCRRQ